MAESVRLRACVDAHASAVWRVLRRNGVFEADADDAAQKVFLVFARKLHDVEEGRELAFLLRTATFVASEARRAHRRRHESGEPVSEMHASLAPSPHDAAVHREGIARLDAILEEMDETLRAIFVLYELEEMTMAEIADALELPPGTVASRLRRARECFEELAARAALAPRRDR